MAKTHRDERQESATPTGKMARTAVAGMTAARMGAKQLRLLSKRPFLSRESFAEQQTKTNDEIADVMFQGLTKLRGGALKVAQMLSLEVGILPDSYIKELSKSHYRVPPLNRALIRKLLIAEFGKPPEEIFAKFEATAFAAASLGQVHKAQAYTGESLAVKVQYPGIGTALHSDIQMVKRFIPPRFKTKYVSGIIQELEHRLSEEIDYGLEYRNTQYFYEHTQLDGITIPKPFASYSSAHVLTTEFIDGLHLDTWLETKPSQEVKDRVAQRMFDFYMHSFFALNRIHSDPNLGNYLLHGDGRITVIDFGSVKIFTQEFCNLLRALWNAILRNDMQQIVSCYCDLGLANGDRILVEELCRTTLAPMREWLIRPYREEVFDFGQHADFCDEGTRLSRDLMASGGIDGFTTESVYFDRNTYGLYRLFTRLQAKVRMRNPWIT